MSLQGGTSWPAGGLCTPAGGWRIASWNARYDARSDTIAGSFSFVTQKRITSCYYAQDLVVNAVGVSLSRRAVLEQPFQGHWEGTYVIRDCRLVGWTFCAPAVGDSAPFDLWLTQNGTTVTGALAWPGLDLAGLPVTGVVGADGQTLTLQASRSWPVSCATQVLRLTSWSTRRDVVGRMQGSFGIASEVHWTPGCPGPSGVYSTSYVAELQSVVLVPWP